MGHLDIAMRESVLNLSNLTVLTDATTQKIALKKWVASECKIQVRYPRFKFVVNLLASPIKSFFLFFEVNTC